MTYVCDSCVGVKWALPESDSALASRIQVAYEQRAIHLIAPDVYPSEVANALTRAERQQRIAVGDAGPLWAGLMLDCPVLKPSYPLTSRAIAISSHYRIGFYDCLYVALAEVEGCELITADARLVTVLGGVFPFIVALANWP